VTRSHVPQDAPGELEQLGRTVRVAPLAPLAPLVAEVCADLALRHPPADEVRRHLGYPAQAVPPARIADRIEAVTVAAAAALRPRGAFAIHAVTGQTPHRLHLAGATIRGDVARFVGTVDRVAIVVATVGPDLSKLADRYAAEGDTLGAWIADADGSWAAEAAADEVAERVRAHAGPGETVTLRYSPGYCGMAMTQQAVLFGLVDAAAAGVTLLPSMLMQPLKSVSGIVGIGYAAGPDAVASTSPCDACGRVNCPMRR
jgi:cytochrome c551/c552